MLKFKIYGQIMTKQRPRASYFGGHPHIYTPKTTINYENYVKSCYLDVADGYTFGNKPVSISINAYFKAPKKYEKYGDDIRNLACDKNKDLDNIAKIICDSLNKIAYDDDKQIVHLQVAKYWTNGKEHIEVGMFSDTEVLLPLDIFKIKYKPNRRVKNEIK